MTICHLIGGWLHNEHYDAITWKRFPRYWYFVRGIHRSQVDSPPVARIFVFCHDVILYKTLGKPLRWRHNEHDSVSNHQPHDCLLNRLFRRRSKKTSKLRVTGLCAGNSPGTGEFPALMASNAENASISWRHHGSWWFGTPRWSYRLLSNEDSWRKLQ